MNELPGNNVAFRWFAYGADAVGGFISAVGGVVLVIWLLTLVIRKRAGDDKLAYGLVQALYLTGLVAAEHDLIKSCFNMGCPGMPAGTSGSAFVSFLVSRVLSTLLLHLSLAFAFAVAVRIRFGSRTELSISGLLALLAATAAFVIHLLEIILYYMPPTWLR